MKANGYLREFEHPEWGTIAVPVAPYGFSATPIEPAMTAPELGADTVAVLVEAGYTDDEVRELRDQGAW